MKTLYLIRHGQAHAGEPDKERRLTTLGQRQAHWVAQQFQDKKIYPDSVISSPAQRARQTAEIISNELGYSTEQLQLQPVIYSGDQMRIITIIRAFESTWHQVFLVGHNPYLSELVYTLCQKKIQLPPCGVVSILFDQDQWHNNSSTLLFTLLPPDDIY